MLTIGIKRVEKFVQQQQALGNDVRWDGYDLVFFRKADSGIFSKAGAFRNGVWGFENRVQVNGKGEWEIDYRNVRRSKRSGR